MQAEMVKKLQQAGKNFDRDYVDAEIQGHNKLLQIQNTYLASGKNETQIDVAKLAKGMITEHLALLSDIQKNGVHG
jgi:putative membrane protein